MDTSRMPSSGCTSNVMAVYYCIQDNRCIILYPNGANASDIAINIEIYTVLLNTVHGYSKRWHANLDQAVMSSFRLGFIEVTTHYQMSCKNMIVTTLYICHPGCDIDRRAPCKIRVTHVFRVSASSLYPNLRKLAQTRFVNQEYFLCVWDEKCSIHQFSTKIRNIFFLKAVTSIKVLSEKWMSAFRLNLQCYMYSLIRGEE